MAEYSKMKNDELQALLKERNLATTGKKADMVARLQTADKSNSAPKSEASKPTPAAAAAEPATPASKVEPNTTEDGTKEKTSTTTIEGAKPDSAPEDSTAEQEKTEGNNPEQSFSANLAVTSVDEELERRKKRAAKFGMSEQDSDAIRNLERQKRFGTGPEAAATDGESNDKGSSGVNRLDQALPERRARGGKRARDDSGTKDFEDRGLKRRRGGGRGGRSGRGGRGGRPNGNPRNWMSEADKAAAEKRKAKFGA